MSDLPAWAQPDEVYPSDAPPPSWGGPVAVSSPPPPAPSPPPPSPSFGAEPDPVEVNALRAGFLVVPQTHQVDIEAARLLGRPEGDAFTDGVSAPLGIAFNADGLLVVAWPDLPTPPQVRNVERRTGHSVLPAVAGKATYNVLFWQVDDLLKNDFFQVSLEPLVDMVVKEGASDLHIATGERPRLRVGGTFREIKGQPPLTAEDALRLVRQVVGPEFDPEKFDGDWDLSITVGSLRFRVNVFLARSKLAMALRAIPVAIPKFEDLGLPEAAKRFAGFGAGLVIFGGATGSGKSTSLAALLDIVNKTREVNIVTLEAPIEYLHSSQVGMVHQREVGYDTVDFQRGLKSALRQDPDVILVGEMRDYEEMALAITAAETGHLVFVTVHAHNMAGVIDRIIDVFPTGSQNQVRTQLANILLGVVCQKLLPDAQDPRRRHLAYEIGFVNPAIRAVIADNAKSNARITEALMSGRAQGMLPFDACLARLVIEEKVALSEAQQHAIDDEIFRKMLEGERRRARGVQDE